VSYKKEKKDKPFLLQAIAYRELVKSDFDIEHDSVEWFILILYTVFIIVLHIILLNMLIAIMNDSYSYINKKHGHSEYTRAISMSILAIRDIKVYS